ncbi:MAG: RagB/SusD family nutrient uptake outer membrane protein [Bacteroidales bacterium]|jgi:hypothetical protein|nr:RagB/SusD family nutrient uptake outer membrane protein [Bacteroidales bacterium]
MKKLIIKIKKSFFFTSLVLLSVAFNSCNDNDEEPVDEVTDELVITNDADAANFVKSIFKTQNCGSGYSFLLETVSEATVSFEGPDTESGPLVSQFDIQPNNDYLYIWGKQYAAVAEANAAIEKISSLEAGEGKILSEYGKNTALGGAYFVRGLAYFYLVQLWGEIPLYLSTQDATNGSPVSVNEIYTQIEKDLKKAEELLPELTSYKTEPNKYAADAILSKVYLTWAQYSPEGDLPKPPADNAKLANAVTYADKVINSGRYILLDNITDNWGRYKKNGQEHIYNISYVLGEDGPNDGGNHQAHCAFSYGFEADPSTQPPHIGPSSFDLYEKWDGGHAGNELDQRREFSYTAHLAKPNSAKEFNLDHDSVYAFTPPKFLPYFGKGIDRSFYEGPLVGPTERDMDRIEIRYAEVLLIKAEALIESNQNLSGAKALINQVRHRAYINAPDPTVYYVTTTSQDELRDAVQQERFNEFVYEQKRFLDLTRWHRLVRTVQTVKDFTEYSASYASGSLLQKVQDHLKKRYTAVTNSGTKYYHFPIPESALETNPNLKNK